MNVSPAASANNASHTARRHNLPAQTTLFVGRERELAQIRDLLLAPDVRLLTLTGTAGTGKTRLTIEAAARLHESFADGLFLVSLAALNDPALVAPTIAHALGIKEQGGQMVLQSVKDQLAEHQTLLILDNFEQILGAAPLVAELLAACPWLKIVVTSRVTLHLYGEHIMRVPPLPVPPRADSTAEAGATEIGNYAAVQLFLARARAVQPDFALDASSLLAVAELCRRLDGLPLAIELAASRSGVLSVGAMLARGENRLKLLTRGPLDFPERMQSLRNTLEWSYTLLTAEEQRLFARLAVFVGGGTLQAISQICDPADDWVGTEDLLDLATSLVDKSLLLHVGTGDGTRRFALLETLREFAQEKLVQRGELDLLRLRHSYYYLALAEAGDEKLRGPEELAGLDLLEHEHDNIRAAGQLFGEHGDTAGGLRLVGALGRFWQLHGHYSEGRQRSAAVLSLPIAPEHSAARAKAARIAGRLALAQSDLAQSLRLFEESLHIRQELADRPGVAEALNELGIEALARGDLGTARTYFEESLQIRRELDDPRALVSQFNNLAVVAVAQGDNSTARRLCAESMPILTALGDDYGVVLLKISLGRVLFNEGDYPGAQKLYRESLALLQAFGDESLVATIMHDLGLIAYRQGDLAAAQGLFASSLATKRRIGDRRTAGWVLLSMGYLALAQDDYAAAAGMLGESLGTLRGTGDQYGFAEAVAAIGQLAAALSRPTRAARLFGAAEALLATCAARMQHAYRPDYQAAADGVRRHLGKARFAGLCAEGAALSDVELYSQAAAEIEQALQAPQEQAQSAPAAYPGDLSEREVEVLRLVAGGLSNAQVAARLTLSPYTINAHLRAIYRKLGLTTRAAAIQFAADTNLV